MYPYLCYYHTTVVVLEEVNCIRDKPSTHFPTPPHLSLHPFHLSAVVSQPSIYVCVSLLKVVCVCVWLSLWCVGCGVVLDWLHGGSCGRYAPQYIYTHIQHTHFLSSWEKTGSGVCPTMASLLVTHTIRETYALGKHTSNRCSTHSPPTSRLLKKHYLNFANWFACHTISPKSAVFCDCHFTLYFYISVDIQISKLVY